MSFQVRVQGGGAHRACGVFGFRALGFRNMGLQWFRFLALCGFGVLGSGLGGTGRGRLTVPPSPACSSLDVDIHIGFLEYYTWFTAFGACFHRGMRAEYDW